jgi:myosin heavy subunit
MYSTKLVWGKTAGNENPRQHLEPHVYEVLALSYKGLTFEGNDQSILVLGESGAGKRRQSRLP